MNNITLVKLTTVHLYLDIKKKIIILEILNSNYSKDDYIIVLEYFKNFWILAKEQNVKYYLLVIINNIGIYPLSFYNYLIIFLNEINDLLLNHLICCCFLCKEDAPIKILKPLFSMYKFVRPYNISNTYEDVLLFFNKQLN